MINWINQKFDLNLIEGDLIHVRNFSVIWNIFDNFVCESKFSINRIEAIYSSESFGLGEFVPYFMYFHERYTIGNSTNERFERLRFRPNDRKEFVRSALLENNLSSPNLLLASTIIVYRIRCNLFHGLKDFRFLDLQEENFDNANHFLMTVIDNYGQGM